MSQLWLNPLTGRWVTVAVSRDNRPGDLISRQRIDMVVDERLVVEAKSTQDLHKFAPRQVYNYLRETRLEVGLLMHFGPEPAFYRLIHSHPVEAR